MDEETPDEALQAAVVEVLGGGPMALAALSQRLDERGQLDWLRRDGVDDDDLPGVVSEYLLDTDAVWWGPDDLVALTGPLTDGLVLTHRLSAEEVAAEEVLVNPDLDLLDWDSEELHLAGGGALVERPGDSKPGENLDSLVGPAGWLGQYSAGDVLAFARDGDSVELQRVEEVGAGDHEVELLRRAVASRIPEGHGEESSPLILDALTLDPSSFRHPVRPLGELLVAAGLERRGFSFGRAGEEWRSAREVWLARQRQTVMSHWGMTRSRAESFDAVLDAFEQFGHGVAPERAVAHHLGNGLVAMALYEYAVKAAWDEGAQFREFVEALAVGGPRRAAPAQFLLAVLAERRRDLAAAEELLRAALRGDPDFAAAALILAEFEIDRSNVDSAIALLRHPGLEESGGDDILEHLEHFRSTQDAAFHGVGRNDPCPCGSGRKFKVCHQSGRRPPLSTRTALLMHKVSRFASNPEQREQLVSVALAACVPEDIFDEDDDDEDVDVLEKMGEAMVFDFALWEGGLVATYLEHRGELLPDDERDLLGALAQQGRQLWEIIEVDPGRGLSLRDTASGDVVELKEHKGSLGRQQGEYVLARVARLSDGPQMVGTAMSIPLHLRDSALAMVDRRSDALEWAAWYGRATGPPRLANREGEELLLCRVELSTATAAADVEAVLSTLLEGQDDGTWVELFDLPDGERLVRGSVSYAGSTLVVEADSARRSERLVDLVCAAFPDATVVDEDYTEPLRALDGSAADLGLPEPPDADMAALLDRLIREKELEWVEESIPALGGLTPRQALDDPTRKEDLLALLREFEGYGVPEGAGGFNVGRLRALLGL